MSTVYITPPMFVTSTANIAEGERPRALVLVLGFGGAKPKHVARYAQLYNSKGCTTVSGTASTYDLFVDHNGIDVFAKEAVHQVANALRENDATHPTSSSDQETPIIMHIISNGGAFVAKSIGVMINERDPKEKDDELDLFAHRLKLGCQVFDSAPCYLDTTTSFNVIKQLIPNPLIGIPAAILFAIITKIIPIVLSLVSNKPTLDKVFWSGLLEDSNCSRQAFVYTRKDPIANASKIEEFMEERKKRGVQVMAKHFEDSLHVQHIRIHEKEYSAFIDRVLTDIEYSKKDK